MRTNVMVLVVLGILVLTACGNDKPDSLDWDVSSFSYTDQQNESYGLNDLDGKVWIANFIFTHCETVCPPMTSNLARLQEKLKAKDTQVEIVSFTVDPMRDDPEALTSFANERGAELTNWHFLTGYSFEEIKALSEGDFKAAVTQPNEGDDQFVHGTSFYLIDQSGTVVEKYNGLSNVPYEQIIDDVSALQ